MKFNTNSKKLYSLLKEAEPKPPVSKEPKPPVSNTQTQTSTNTVTQKTSTPPKEEKLYSYYDREKKEWSKSLMTFTEMSKYLDSQPNSGEIFIWKKGGEYGDRGVKSSEIFLRPASIEEPKPETPWNEGYPDCAKKYREAELTYRGEPKMYYTVVVNVMKDGKSTGRVTAVLTSEAQKISVTAAGSTSATTIDGYKAFLEPALSSGVNTAFYYCENENLVITDLQGNKDVYQVGEFKSATTSEQSRKSIDTYNKFFGLPLFDQNNSLDTNVIIDAAIKIKEKIDQNYRGIAIGNFMYLMKSLLDYAKVTGDDASKAIIVRQAKILNSSIDKVVGKIKEADFEVDDDTISDFKIVAEQMTLKGESYTIYQEMKAANVRNYSIFTDPDPNQQKSFTSETVQDAPFTTPFTLWYFKAKSKGLDVLNNLQRYATMTSWSSALCQGNLDALYSAAHFKRFTDPETGEESSIDIDLFNQLDLSEVKRRVCICFRDGSLTRNENNPKFPRKTSEDNIKKRNLLSSSKTPVTFNIECGMESDANELKAAEERRMKSNLNRENDMRIKDILKKKLVEVKETKTKIIQESNIINTRFNFILESSPVKTKKQLTKVFEKTILEMVYLHNQGFDKKLIGESLENMFGVLKNVFKGKDEEIAKEFRNTGVNMILSSLNVENNQKMREYLDKSLKSTDTKDIPSLLTDPNFLADKLADASIESYMEDLSENMGGEFMNAVNSSIKDVIKRSDLKDKIQNRITGITRPIVDRVNQKFEDKLNSVKSSLISKKDNQA